MISIGIDLEAYKAVLRKMYSRLSGFWSRYRDEDGMY